MTLAKTKPPAPTERTPLNRMAWWRRAAPAPRKIRGPASVGLDAAHLALALLSTMTLLLALTLVSGLMAAWDARPRRRGHPPEQA